MHRHFPKMSKCFLPLLIPTVVQLSVFFWVSEGKIFPDNRQHQIHPICSQIRVQHRLLHNFAFPVHCRLEILIAPQLFCVPKDVKRWKIRLLHCCINLSDEGNYFCTSHAHATCQKEYIKMESDRKIARIIFHGSPKTLTFLSGIALQSQKNRRIFLQVFSIQKIWL